VASVEKKDIPSVSEFMSCFWAMIKMFWIPENSDEYWGGVTDYADKFHKKFNNDFCDEMILSFLDYLDEKFRKEILNEQTTKKSTEKAAK